MGFSYLGFGPALLKYIIFNKRGFTIKKITLITLVVISSLIFCSQLYAKTAIIIASFRTNVPPAVQSITHIASLVKAAFCDAKIRIIFTSNMIRSIWKKRSKNLKEWIDKGILGKILYAKKLFSTFEDLKSQKFKYVTFQSIYLFHMEQFTDLIQNSRSMHFIKTISGKCKSFNKIVLDRSAHDRLIPKINKRLLKAMIFIARDHVANNTTFDEDHSWKIILSNSGFKVERSFQSLGSNNQFAELSTNHIRDDARASGFDL